MYDSIIFGYGLTLEANYRIRNLRLPYYSEKYLDFNTLLADFVNAKEHSRIRLDYFKLVDILNNDILLVHEEVRQTLKEKFDDITTIGFERWVSRYLLSNNQVTEDSKLAIYLLYNFWFSKIDSEVLSDKRALKIINDLSDNIMNKSNNDVKIYTTNFDTMFDKTLSPAHLHGKFKVPFIKANQIINHFISETEFEYDFLFGTSGYEKMTRLDKINEIDNQVYDLDFFFDLSINIGHVLLIGLSFSETEVIPEEILSKHTSLNQSFIFNSVDGHILLRLKILKDNNQLSQITYAYYSEAGKEHFRRLIDGTSLEGIVNFIDSKSIL